MRFIFEGVWPEAGGVKVVCGEWAQKSLEVGERSGKICRQIWGEGTDE